MEGTHCCTWLYGVWQQEGWDITWAPSMKENVGLDRDSCRVEGKQTVQMWGSWAIPQRPGAVWHGCPSSRVQIIPSVSFRWWLTGPVGRWQCSLEAKVQVMLGQQRTPGAKPSASCCTTVLYPFWGCQALEGGKVPLSLVISSRPAVIWARPWATSSGSVVARGGWSWQVAALLGHSTGSRNGTGSTSPPCSAGGQATRVLPPALALSPLRGGTQWSARDILGRARPAGRLSLL